MILDIKLDEGCQEIEVDFGQIHQITGGDVPVYSGAYSVVPRVAEKSDRGKNTVLRCGKRIRRKHGLHWRRRVKWQFQKSFMAEER